MSGEREVPPKREGEGQPATDRANFSVEPRKPGELLLELLSEEIPAGIQRRAVEALRELLRDKLSAAEFLRFAGGLHRLGRAEASTRTNALLEQFGLAPQASELVETFSHGMKQRLALAAALIHRPRILVLDEPMVGLDPQGALEFRRLLGRLAADGVTIFLSTHSLAVAEELCHRIGIIDRGKLVALGSLADLRARRHNRLGAASLEAVFLDILGAETTTNVPR